LPEMPVSGHSALRDARTLGGWCSWAWLPQYGPPGVAGNAYAGRLQPRNDLLGLLELEVFRKGPLLRIVASFSPVVSPSMDATTGATSRRAARKFSRFYPRGALERGMWIVVERGHPPLGCGTWCSRPSSFRGTKKGLALTRTIPRTNAHAPSTNTDGPSRQRQSSPCMG
jgi:hypothetical protein